MAKKQQKLLHKLSSALLSFLLHGKPLPRPPPPTLPPHPPLHRGLPPMAELSSQTLLVDVEGALLLHPSSPASLFVYFMLVAMEAGGLLRGLLLLLLYPLLRCLSRGAAVRVMVMAAFCGLRARRFRAGRAVLPKWFLERGVAMEGAEAMGAAGRRVCVCRVLPRVMVEGLLREYLGAEVVVGRELGVVGGFYTGLMEEGDQEKEVVVEMEKKGEEGGGVVGFSSSLDFLHSPLSSCCKAMYVVSKEEKKKWRALPRDKYPRPLVFHDGRLAFAPTPPAALAMFVWLPFGVLLAAARLAVGLLLPYKYSTPVLSATGMTWRLRGAPPASAAAAAGELFVCNHRTLLDPIYVAVALDRPVRAVSYSLSRVSELISPIRTVRLARSREQDGRAMAALLRRGERVVVCPEGTTCREPSLLRFSPLFAELCDGVVPVALAVATSTFYATTAGGLKCLDPLYYLMNPSARYEVEFLARVDTSGVRRGAAASTAVANRVQEQIGMALGFACTMLTRRDKYLMLAGNDGCVRPVATHARA